MREKLTEDKKYMKEAIRQAKKAWKLEEVPIGCVIVHEGKIIGRGYNRRTTDIIDILLPKMINQEIHQFLQTAVITGA